MVMGKIEMEILNVYIINVLILMGFVGCLGLTEVVDDCDTVTAIEPESGRGIEIYVDQNGTGDYITIKDAIDNANSGDTIYVWSGKYKEHVLVDKTIT